jgi:hypothetical protein
MRLWPLALLLLTAGCFSGATDTKLDDPVASGDTGTGTGNGSGNDSGNGNGNGSGNGATASSNIAELFAKNSSELNDELYGVYELVSQQPEQRVTLNITERTEIRPSRLAYGRKCEATGAQGPASGQVFGSAPISVSDTGMQIIEGTTQKQPLRAYGVDCVVEIKAGPLPFCVDGKVPAGGSAQCLSYGAGQNLRLIARDGTVTDRGKKVAN